MANTIGEIHPHVRQLRSIGTLYLPSSIARKRAESGRKTVVPARELEFLSRTLDYSEWSSSRNSNFIDAISVAITVRQCASLARNISRSNSPLFSMRRDRRTNAPIFWTAPSGQAFILSTIDENTARLEKHSPYCQFNPYVDLFLKVRTQFLQSTSLLPMETDNTAILVGELNRAIESIRSEARSGKFRKDLDLFQRGIRKNYWSVKRYLKSICENRQDYALFDIKLFLPNAAEIHSDVALEDTRKAFQSHRLEWFKKIKKNLPKDSLIGHVWSIHYGFRFAWHYRVIAVLKVTSDDSPESWFPGVVQETWADTVKGATYCIQALIPSQRTNNPANRYKSHMDEPNRTLTDIASALTKPDYFAKATVAHGKRILGKGVLHSKKTNYQK